MDKIKIERYSDYQLRSTDEWVMEEVEAFKKMHKLNESYRYINGSYYRFADPEVNKRYGEWARNLTMGEYYSIVGMTYANTD